MVTRHVYKNYFTNIYKVILWWDNSNVVIIKKGRTNILETVYRKWWLWTNMKKRPGSNCKLYLACFYGDEQVYFIYVSKESIKLFSSLDTTRAERTDRRTDTEVIFFSDGIPLYQPHFLWRGVKVSKLS